MTAKAKAIQVLVAVSVTAVAYTLYTNNGKKPVPPQVKGETAMSPQKNKAMQPKPAAKSTAVYNESAVPGYSNPEENSK